MAGADGIASHLLEDTNLSRESTHVYCRPKDAQVMVVAHAVDSNPHSVQHKSLLGCKFRFPDPDDGAGGVDHHPAAPDARLHGVEIRRPEGPKLRCMEPGLGLAFPRAASRDVDLSLGCFASCDPRAGFGNAHRDGDLYRLVRLVVDLRPDPDGCAISGNVRGRDVAPPMGHMHRRTPHKPDVSVNSAAGIPTGRVGRILQSNGENVLPVEEDLSADDATGRLLQIQY